MAKKIIVIGTRGIPDVLGGVETHCQELYPRLVELGFDVSVFARKSYVGKKENYYYRGVKVIPVFSPKKKAFEAIFHSIICVFKAKRIGCDILHIHAIGPSLVTPLAKILGLTVIVTNHGPDYDRQKWGRTARIMLKIGERAGTRHADELIVISKVIDDIIKKKYKRFNAHLVFNGINKPIKTSKPEFINSLGLVKYNYIIAVGRFVEEKGFHDLIEAYSRIKKPNAKLVIAGDADHETLYSKKIKKMAANYGVLLTGFIKGEKLNEFFSFAKAFIMPSYHEGLPIALLEALSYDLRVVVSDIPANLEVSLKSDCYFETGNIKELASKIKEIDVQEYFPVVYNLDLYNWDSIAEEVSKIYNKKEIEV